MTESITMLDEQQVRDRHWRTGVDYGSKIRVLVTDGRRELWWRAGNTGWASRGMAEYYKAQLYLVDTRDRNYYGVVLAEGGRLSRALLDRYAAKIDEFFGQPVAKFLHPKKTVKIP